MCQRTNSIAANPEVASSRWRRLKQNRFGVVPALVGSHLILLILLFGATPTLLAGETQTAALIANSIGVDLFQKPGNSDTNLCLSPYSIADALAMTYAGTDGVTRVEMARALHFPENESTLHDSFLALHRALEEMQIKGNRSPQQTDKRNLPDQPVTLAIANRLFAQEGFEVRSSFVALVKEKYDAPLLFLDFKKDANAARKAINDWVDEQTSHRIRDLIPGDGLEASARLVLANAIYLKAPWAESFSESASRPESFHVRGGIPVEVPTMQRTGRDLGYAKREGFTAVTIPYRGGNLQFLILLPDEIDGLPGLQAKLDPEMIADCAKLDVRNVKLHLPKFELVAPTVALGASLRELGMRSAFDDPHGSANFGRLAVPKAGEYLFMSQAFHKTFISVDEKGTEAAAATATTMSVTALSVEPETPVEVTVNRPFLFAVQDRDSGACLFLGRVVDPR
jgi:serpin B